MKIVIDISDATYDYWTRSEARAEYVLADAIKNGIVLPKEADELIVQDNVLKNPTFWQLLYSLKQLKGELHES